MAAAIATPIDERIADLRWTRQIAGERQRSRLNRLICDRRSLIAATTASIADHPRELLFQLPIREYLGSVPRLSVEIARMVKRARARSARDFPEGTDLSRYPEERQRNSNLESG